jgi:hypothetical protein
MPRFAGAKTALRSTCAPQKVRNARETVQLSQARMVSEFKSRDKMASSQRRRTFGKRSPAQKRPIVFAISSRPNMKLFRELVPGIGTMIGDRRSSHAKAT